MQGPAFITLGSGGDLVIVACNRHYTLTCEVIQHLLFCEQDVHLLLPGEVVDVRSNVIAYPPIQMVLFILPGRTFSARWSDITEVVRGDVQYAPLTPTLYRGGP